jgi:hypothetical protein
MRGHYAQAGRNCAHPYNHQGYAVHSMEQEARLVLTRAVGGMTGASLWELSRQIGGQFWNPELY